MNKPSEFSYFSGDIKNSLSLGNVSLDYFIKAHLYPKTKVRLLLEKIQEASKLGLKDEKARLKTQLYSFTPAVIIKKGAARKYDNIESFTGFAQLDFDKIETTDLAVSLKEHLFHSYPEIICSYLSPSGLGVKCLISIKKSESIEDYKATMKSIASEMQDIDYFDPVTKNAVLPLFISYDVNLLYRKKYSTWTKQDFSKPSYDHLNTVPKNEMPDDRAKARVLKILERDFSQIFSDGHPQVRSSALKLGSRVGAGYIDRIEAEQWITNLIRLNSYLQKGVKGYIDTAMWGIREGSKNPRYF